MTALDRGDVETLVDCFTPDGALDSPAVGQHSGHAAIRAFAGRFSRFNERGGQLRHVISNLAVTIEGERAQASCYLLNILTRNDKSELLAPGRYECDLVKSEGNWRFPRRGGHFSPHNPTPRGLAGVQEALLSATPLGFSDGRRCHPQ